MLKNIVKRKANDKLAFLMCFEVVVLKIFTKDEFKMMPAGDKIVKFLEKLKIY